MRAVRDRISDLGGRTYPQTWLLLDVVDRRLRLAGHEIVDLAPAAIELRSVARELSRYAEERERWLAVQKMSGLARLDEGHRHALSFGPRLVYCVEHDRTRTVNGGRPFRHLSLEMVTPSLTPATTAEIGLYFYGRRPATFGFTGARSVHGFIGMDWESLDGGDVDWLLRREMETGS